MSLLIEHMDMPKNGRVTIELASEETGTNILARITDDKTGKSIEHKGAVVITTPHGRLIDAEKLLRALAVLKYMATVEGDRLTFSEILEEIAKAPTVIEKENTQ